MFDLVTTDADDLLPNPERLLEKHAGFYFSLAIMVKFVASIMVNRRNLVLEQNLAMTKADLVEEVTQLGDLTRRDGEVIVDTIFDSVIHALKTGDKIEIRGFGSFRIRQRKPRIGRNPKTGAKVEVPGQARALFQAQQRITRFSQSKSGASAPAPDPHSA